MAGKVDYYARFTSANMADRVNLLLIQNDMTKTRLSELMNCDRKRIYALLGNYTSFNTGDVSRVCEIFKVTPNYLFGLEG